MSRNSIKYFIPEDGKMDEIIRILEEEKGAGRRDNNEVYHFNVCTFRVDRDNNEIGVEGKHPMAVFYSVARLEEKVGIELKEIK